jgi:glycerophosphoryl diester phosphodiesterase
VNAPEDILRAIETGVDGIITDYPGRAQRLLLDRGLSWREDIHPVRATG